jgi:hypothetical protein
MLMSLHCFHFDCADGSLSVLFGIDCLAVFDVLDAKRLNLLCKLTLFSGPLDCLSSARWIAVRPPPREIIKTHKATTSIQYCCVHYFFYFLYKHLPMLSNRFLLAKEYELC